MTKKHSKRTIAKSLGAVLLAIILGASWIPAAALEGERTECGCSSCLPGN